MALSRDIVIRLLGDASSAVAAQQAAARAAEVSVQQYRKAEREYDRQRRAAETASRQQREAMASVGRGAAVMGAAVVAGLGLSVKAAIDWESAWAGVRKTVNGSPAEMAALEKELRNLATTLPATHEEIAGVAEAAGQLGIARGDIVEFTKVAVAMGVSTNLSAQDAATGMAQMMNVMGTADSDVDRLASTLVALGNAGASTEADILSMGQRIAGAANIIGASESDALALANTLASLGINAELGGGAMTRVLLKINTAMMEGGKTAQDFAKVAGMSADEFAAAWQADPIKALAAFTDGLGRVKNEGGNVTTTLDDLGITGTQNMQVMLGLAGAQGQLADNLALGNKAWAENTALMNEANQRYDTAASRIKVARNQITDAAIDIGGTFMPLIAGAAETVADLARGFQMLPGPVKVVVEVIGGLAGVLGLAGGAALIAIPKIVAFRATMTTLSTSASAAARGVSRFGMVMTGPWGIAITAGITLLGSLVGALGASSRASESAAAYQKDLAAALRESGGAIDDNVRALAAHKAADEEFADTNLLEVVEKAAGPNGLPKLTNALLGVRGDYEDTRASLERFIQQQTRVNEMSGDVYLTKQGEAAKEALTHLDDLTQSMGGAIGENKRLAEATKESTDATGAATGATQGLLSGLNDVAGASGAAAGGIAGTGAAAEGTEEQFAAATEEIVAWRKELQSVAKDFVDPLGAYKDLLSEKTAAEQKSAQATADSTKSAKDSWEDYADDVSVTLDELADRLQEQLETQANWRKNVVAITKRGGTEVGEAIAAMGEEGVDLAEKMANGSDKEFKRMARLILADVRNGGDDWTASMDTDMKVMARIGKNGASTTAAAIAHELGIGAAEVAAIAKRYGINLASGINPILHALGKPSVQGYNTGGGYAEGGYISGPGGPTDDLIPARLSNGEYVIQAKAVQRIGKDRLDQLNQGRLPESPGFATGGYVSTKDVPRPPGFGRYSDGMLGDAAEVVTDRMYDEVVAYVKKMGVGGPGVQNALRWARTQVGKPYIWGGVGPAGFDCSGWISAITNVIQGKSPYARRGSTANFPWAGFAPGVMGGFSVGSTTNAGGGIGHMAGTLGGVNVESYGGHGPAVGSGARGANDPLFSTRAHLVGSYQTGTAYVPSDGYAYLHKGERVVPAEHNRSWMSRLMAPLNRASAPSSVVVNVNGARVVGRLEVNADGFAELVDGMIEGALVSVENRGRY